MWRDRCSTEWIIWPHCLLCIKWTYRTLECHGAFTLPLANSNQSNYVGIVLLFTRVNAEPRAASLVLNKHTSQPHFFLSDVCKQFDFAVDRMEGPLAQLDQASSNYLRKISVIDSIIQLNVLFVFAEFLLQLWETHWFTSARIVHDAARGRPSSASVSLCNKAMCTRCKAPLNISPGAQWVTPLAGCCKKANNGEGNGSAHFLWKGITFLIYH